MQIEIIQSMNGKIETKVLENVIICNMRHSVTKDLLCFGLEEGSGLNCYHIISHAQDPNFQNDIDRFGIKKTLTNK